MHTHQAGIFALGTSSYAYLEFDLLEAKKCNEFASALASIREPRMATGGVNFVIGFRPELGRDVARDDAPSGVEGFNKEIRGTEGFVMPCKQLVSMAGKVNGERDALTRYTQPLTGSYYFVPALESC